MTQAPTDITQVPEGDALPPWVCDPSCAFVTPDLERVLDVWRQKRGTRTMPARNDLTIRDLAFALPNVGFVDIVKDGDRLRFRVRLMGSALDALVVPMTGRFIDEVVSERFAEKWAMQWRPAIDHRAPMRAVARVEFFDRRWFVSEALYAPLAVDGETPDVLMIASYYHAIEDSRERVLADRLMQELAAKGVVPR